MAKCDLYNMSGEVVGEIELRDDVFAIEYVSEGCMHNSVVNTLANRRQGTQSTKTKSEVAGGGRKPWKQKGTGRARQGSIRSAQWIKGGIVHGPKPRSYRYTLPKKMKRLALLSAFTTKLNNEDLIIVDQLTFDEIKTKAMINVLDSLKVDTSALIVTASNDITVIKSASNIPSITTAMVNTINVYDILKHSKLILTKDAVTKIEEVYTK
ncbi:MAG: 50S ribosomal protein L4 [Bacillota bacterium]